MAAHIDGMPDYSFPVRRGNPGEVLAAPRVRTNGRWVCQWVRAAGAAALAAGSDPMAAVVFAPAAPLQAQAMPPPETPVLVQTPRGVPVAVCLADATAGGSMGGVRLEGSLFASGRLCTFVCSASTGRAGISDGIALSDHAAPFAPWAPAASASAVAVAHDEVGGSFPVLVSVTPSGGMCASPIGTEFEPLVARYSLAQFSISWIAA